MCYRTIGAWSALLCTLSLVAGVASAQQSSSADFVYRARAGDTLIGFGQRALVNPGRWRELQQRNGIRNPQRIPVGTAIRVPQDWLRQSVVSAEVLQTIGAVQVDGRALTRGELLGEGTTLTTGSDGFVTLRFADGGLVIVQAESRLIVQRLRRYDGIRQHDTQIRLEAGRANSQLTPSPAVGRFEIATPVAVSAVRGTEFRTQFDTARTLAGAEVTQGLVGVVGAASAGVSVPAGFGTTTDVSGTPTPPVRLLPAPRWVVAPERWSTSNLEAALLAIPGAVGYRAQLARDEQLREVVSQTSNASPIVRFDGLTDGEYWIRVHAVDANSLAGFDTIQRVSVALLPDAPALLLPAIDGKSIGSSTELSWQTAAAGQDFRLQVARDADFGDVIVDVPRLSSDRYRAEGLSAGSYYWRVATLRADGAAGDWSAPRRFVQKSQPLAPTLTSLDKRAFVVAWARVPGETTRLQISRDPAFATTSIDTSIDAEQFAWRGGGPGKYHVRVQTTDTDGFVGPWSPAASIDLPPPRWIRWMPLVSVVPLLLL